MVRVNGATGHVPRFECLFKGGGTAPEVVDRFIDNIFIVSLAALAANVGCVMSAGRGKFTPEMSNVATCWRHVDTFSENIIAKRISTYIHTDSYVRSRYGKLILCHCDSPMSAKSSDSVACR